MNNTLEIESGESSVQATLNVRAKKVGKIVVLSMILVAQSLIIWILAEGAEKEGDGALIFVGLIVTALIIAFPVRYLLWNSFGKEKLTITKDNITVYFDYGMWRTTPNTIEFGNLRMRYERYQNDDKTNKGVLILADCNDETNEAWDIFRTTVLLDASDVTLIQQHIVKLLNANYAHPRRFEDYILP